MVFYTSVWACLIISAILVLHILSAVLRGRISQILSYVNLALHLPLVAVLLVSGAELSELVLIFMASLLVSLFSALISERVKKRREEGNDI